MSDADDTVRSLFTAPGHSASVRHGLLVPAADAHALLLERAEAHAGPLLVRALAPIDAYLAGRAPPAEKRRLLCHPLLIEGLHALSAYSAELKEWHDRVTSCTTKETVAASSMAALGSVALAVQLRSNRDWYGRCDLCTDTLGRLSFPFSDWTLQLHSDRGDPLADRGVSFVLDHDRGYWRLDDAADHPYLVMPRSDCVRMLTENRSGLDGHGWIYPDPAVRPRLTRACRLGQSSIRFDPMGIDSESSHAGITGGLVAGIVDAIRQDSPAIYREFRTYVHTIRGFEFPRLSGIASFSDPTLPGVMGMSVPYTDSNEPCLDPFCFTWFGHEMGHTKDYLCDTILYAAGESLVTNAGEWSGVIPRYGRPLSVRTLIQVPYVHLYEWALLMDFCEAHFCGLPWKVSSGAATVGDDCAAEIQESFDLIGEHADLTPVGVAAVRHFRTLFDEANDRWQRVRTLA